MNAQVGASMTIYQIDGVDDADLNGSELDALIADSHPSKVHCKQAYGFPQSVPEELLEDLEAVVGGDEDMYREMLVAYEGGANWLRIGPTNGPAIAAIQLSYFLPKFK